MNGTRIEFAGPGVMFISAVLFGFFGFVMQLNPIGVNGQHLLYIPIFVWTMRASAIAFALAGLMTFKAPLAGNLIYTVAGLLSAIMFVIVAVMDIQDKQHTIMPYAPFLLFVFAAWNGWGSWQGLRAVMFVLGSGRATAPQQAA